MNSKLEKQYTIDYSIVHIYSTETQEPKYIKMTDYSLARDDSHIKSTLHTYDRSTLDIMQACIVVSKIRRAMRHYYRYDKVRRFNFVFKDTNKVSNYQGVAKEAAFLRRLSTVSNEII